MFNFLKTSNSAASSYSAVPTSDGDDAYTMKQRQQQQQKEQEGSAARQAAPASYDYYHSSPSSTTTDGGSNGSYVAAAPSHPSSFLSNVSEKAVGAAVWADGRLVAFSQAYCDSAMSHSVEHREVLYPVNGGAFAPLNIPMAYLPEAGELPRDEVLSSLAAFNRIAVSQGPHYHLPIYVGGAILLLAGGLVVGVLAAGAAVLYFNWSRARALAALEAAIRQENAKAVYVAHGARWVLSPRGLLLTYSTWELVEATTTTTTTTTTTPVPASDVITPPPSSAPRASLYPSVTEPSYAPAAYPTSPPQAAVAPLPSGPAPTAAPPSAPLTPPSTLPPMTEEQMIALAIRNSLTSQ